MDIIQELKDLDLTPKEKYARKIGLVDNNDRLTDKGRQFLLEVLFEKEENRQEFYEALTAIQEEARGE